MRILNQHKILFLQQARIKKIMQTDEDVGKVAAAVPVLICILYVYRNLIIDRKPHSICKTGIFFIVLTSVFYDH